MTLSRLRRWWTHRAAVPWRRTATVQYRVHGENQRAAFQALGYNKAHPFFPHRSYVLPKAAPDALRLAGWMRGVRTADSVWEILLHAEDPVLSDFPSHLFHDDDLIWHRQHLGRPGHVAYAAVAIRGRDVYGLCYVSDLVQRIGRHRDHKTRIENRFKAWPSLTLHAILQFAADRGATRVWSPVADVVLRHTDPTKKVQRELFERIYDRSVTDRFVARRSGRWWVLDVSANRHRMVAPERRAETREVGRTIAICHDVERHHGHEHVDPGFAERARRDAPGHLATMLRIEQETGVRATYNVVGKLLPEVQPRLRADGHAIAFHSFDHDLHGPQLARCRVVDYRVNGYRPPQSKLTRELSGRNLCLHNFDWLAAHPAAMHVDVPTLLGRVVRLPIAFDDHPLYLGMPYEQWETRALAAIRANDFTAFGLHDCYGEFWLDRYERLIEALRGLGRLVTLEDVARETFFAGSQA